MTKLHVSQVTNQNLVEHFQVSIIDSIYAEDAKGRRKFLTDLRQEYVKEVNKKATSKKYRKTTQKEKRQNNIDDFFVDLDRAFPEYNVAIRETQPGISLPQMGLQIFFMVDAFRSHAVSFYSTVFSREDLEKEFAHYKLLKKNDTDKNSVTVGSVKDLTDLVEITKKAIQMHEAAL